MTIVFQMSERVPKFIESSQLETTKGKISEYHCIFNLTVDSLDRSLVADPQDINTSMPQPMSRDTPTGFRLAATHIVVERASITSPQGMDGHLQRSALPAHQPAA
jgi:hypothetical protein